MSDALSLRAIGLRKTYSRSGFTIAVDDLDVAAGETMALLGPSGSGKTTLLHLLGLLDRPDEGRIVLGDREVSAGDRVARMAMAAVFQRPYLFKGTVGANVAYGLAMRGVPRARRTALVAGALERVGLAGFEDRGSQQLSGGEAQRVSLARALVLEPKVLLLDEPLASLDALLKRKLAEEFARIVSETDATVIWVTHDQDEALMVADSVAIVNEGRVVACGPSDETMGLPADDWTAAFLGVEPPQRGRVAESGGGIVRIQAGSVQVEAVGDAAAGSDVLFSVRPEDVLLFESGAVLPPTSARNQLQATVVSCRSRGATNQVVLDVGGPRLSASVSRISSSELRIAADTGVLAVFKATAVRWRMAEDAPRGVLDTQARQLSDDGRGSTIDSADETTE